jgi:hypothetical protein
LPDASSKINALRGPKSSTNIQCIGKKIEEAKEPRSRTHWQAMSRDHDLAIHQRVQAGSQKRGKENNSETQPSSAFDKDDILTSSTVLPNKISGKIRAKFATPIQQRENYKKRLILRHLSSRFRGSRRRGSVSSSVWWRHRRTCRRSRKAGVEVEEAAEGVIIDTMPGAYFFAFSKKPSSFESGRPREELTFSQSTSSPCE